MKLRNVAGLYLVRLRGRIGQELLALVGIAVGVALLFAALVANSSLTGSFERQTNGLVGKATVQLTAAGGTPLSEQLLRDVKRLPGVANAAGVLQSPSEIRGPGGRRSVLLVGVTPDLGEFGGSYTRGFSYGFLSDVRAVALPTPMAESLGLALAQPVRLAIGGRSVEARLGAKLQTSDIGDAIHSPIALAPLRYAQELAGKPGFVSRIVVLARPGAEAQVRAAVGRLAGDGIDVRPPDFEVELLRQAALPTSQSTAMFSVFGAMVGFLFAFSAMLLTVPQRRRLIADLDVEGYRPRTVLKVLLFDALALGIAGSLLGVVLGDQIARRLFDETPSFLQYAFPVGPGRVVELRDVALAAAGGLAASCVAVLAPTLSAVLGWRERTGRSASRSGRGARLAAAGGLACFAAGVVAVIAAPASATLAIAGLASLTLAMLLLLPSTLRGLVTALEAGTRRLTSVVPFVATFDLRDPTAHARSLAVAATGAVAVFGTVSLQGAHADLLRGLDRTTTDVAGMGAVWALPPGDANLLVTTPFTIPRLEPGSDAGTIAVFRGSFLDVGNRRVSVLGPPASGPFPLSRTQLLDGDLDTALARLRSGGWMVVSESIARDHGLQVGDRFTLPTAVPTPLRVAALSTNMGWPPGAIVLNADDYAHAWGGDDASALLSTPPRGSTPEEGARALRKALGPDSGLTVLTASERQRQQKDASRSALSRLAQIAMLVLVSAIIATATAMAGLIWQRRAFLAGLKVEGYSTAAMWKALLLEASMLIGAGCALGALFGLIGQSLLSRALTSVTGFPVVYSTAAGSALLTCLVVSAAAVTIVGAFGQRAADVAPESGFNP